VTDRFSHSNKTADKTICTYTFVYFYLYITFIIIPIKKLRIARQTPVLTLLIAIPNMQCHEICARLGYYAASYGNCLPTRCTETSVNNYHTKPRNIPEERRSRQHRGGSLKARLHRVIFWTPFPSPPFQRPISTARSLTSAIEVILPTVKERPHQFCPVLRITFGCHNDRTLGPTETNAPTYLCSSYLLNYFHSFV
jgi:hypothetical protein